MIKQITIIAREGVKQWFVGQDGVATIKIEPLYFTGNPFDHYVVGRNDKGEILFYIHPSAPVEVVCQPSKDSVEPYK
jgi:hypothetical protein